MVILIWLVYEINKQTDRIKNSNLINYWTEFQLFFSQKPQKNGVAKIVKSLES